MATAIGRRSPARGTATTGRHVMLATVLAVCPRNVPTERPMILT